MAEIAHTLVLRPTTRAIEIARQQVARRLRDHGLDDEATVEDCIATVETVVDHASKTGAPVVTVNLVFPAEDEVVIEVLAEPPPARPLLRRGTTRRLRSRIVIDRGRGRGHDVAGAPGPGTGS